MTQLRDQTIKNNFLFAATMMQGNNCKDLLEMILGIEIDHLRVNNEQQLMFNPDYHGIRLDVYARDENNTRYDIEIQIAYDYLPKRC